MKGCKNCPAYAKCTVTYRGSACAALRGTYGIDSDPEIVTNADRIRAASDEELARYLSAITYGAVRGVYEKLGIHNNDNAEEFIEKFKPTILEMLQMPAKDDT